MHRVIDSGRTVAEVSRELGVHESLLGRWGKDERRGIAAAEVHGEKPVDAAEGAALLRLRRQVSELEKDNAFLSKASVYCAAMQQNRPGSIRWPGTPAPATLPVGPARGRPRGNGSRSPGWLGCWRYRGPVATST
ncbi:transposase [Nocardia sp. BMG51109]|uniref:transposase n=1 Tax=Nocardia sp. BMG51109 TaxID=1056816 RepID=UPI0012EBFA2C